MNEEYYFCLESWTTAKECEWYLRNCACYCKNVNALSNFVNVKKIRRFPSQPNNQLVCGHGYLGKICFDIITKTLETNQNDLVHFLLPKSYTIKLQAKLVYLLHRPQNYANRIFSILRS